MIFKSTSKHIEQLEYDQLVELMRMLLRVECRKFNIPLSSFSAGDQPLRNDGGEDGRAQWSSFPLKTDFFKSNFCIFQFKARKLTGKILKDEIWRIKETRKVVNEAVDEILRYGGDYIVVTSKHLREQDIDNRVEVICEAIRQAGRIPDKEKIHIYNSAKISEWVNTFPSVALWLSSVLPGNSFDGFQTHAMWGEDFFKVNWVDFKQPRYSIKNNLFPKSEDEADKLRNFDEIYALVVQHFAYNDKVAVRIVGPSGYGKSRLAFELFNKSEPIDAHTDPASVIFADYNILKEEVAKLALYLVDSAISTTLVVDECPDEIHRQLVILAKRPKARFRLISIDIETNVNKALETLTIDVKPAPDEVLAGIIENTCPKLSAVEKDFVIRLSLGFPQMAILAAEATEYGYNPIDSVEQLWERIIWDRKQKNDLAQKAIETLALFDRVGFKADKAAELDLVATKLANIPSDSFEEHIKSFIGRGIVLVRGRYFHMIPIPLAVKLGKDRMSKLPDTKLFAFYLSCPETLKLALLTRLQWLDTSPEAREFARQLLHRDIHGNIKSLASRFGAESFHRLTHINPDAALESLELIFDTEAIYVFKNYGNERYWIILSLEELAFRTSTFHRAATILRKLAASESESYDLNNSITPFRRLFQIYLSTTQAPLTIRLKTLQEGIISKEDKERETTIWAIDNMLSFPHFRQRRGIGQMGSTGPQQEYDPDNNEIEYYISACVALLKDIIASNDNLAGYANKVFEERFRGILDWVSLPKVKELIQSITDSTGVWFSAIRGINEWLYYDGDDFREHFEADVQSLFISLLPNDPLNLILLHTRWNHGLHSPESRLHSNPGTPGDYSSDKLFELAETVRFEQAILTKIVESLSISDAKYVFHFCVTLAQLVDDPIAIFQAGLKRLKDTGQTPNVDFFRGVITGIAINNPDQALDCALEAIHTELFDENAIKLFDHLGKTPKTISHIVEEIADGKIHPWECNYILFITGVEDLSSRELSPLINCLLSVGAEGVWPAIEILVHRIGKNPDSTMEFCQLLKKSFFAIGPLLNNARVKIRGYSLEKLFESLLDCHKSINDELLTTLAEHVFKLCEFRSKLYYKAETAWLKSLKMLNEKSAVSVWNSVVPYLNKPGYSNIKSLISPPNKENEWLGPGILYEVPEVHYLDWVDQDPEARAHKVLWWLPILSSEKGPYKWHPKLETFIYKYYSYPQVLEELAYRLKPGFLHISAQVILGPIISCLEIWINSDNKRLAEWANDTVQPFYSEINSEKIADQEYVFGL